MAAPQPYYFVSIYIHQELDIDPVKDSWMILACDGIWNSMSSEEVVEFVNERIQGTDEDKLSSICEEVSLDFFM